MSGKTTTITVDSEDFEEEFRDYFNFVAKAYSIPRGTLLSRALYLACREVVGKTSMQRDIESMLEIAQTNGHHFKHEVVFNAEEWKQHVRDLGDNCLENLRIKRLTFDKN